MRQRQRQRQSSAAAAAAAAASLNSRGACGGGMAAEEIGAALHTHIKLKGLSPQQVRPVYDDGTAAVAEPIRQSSSRLVNIRDDHCGGGTPNFHDDGGGGGNDDDNDDRMRRNIASPCTTAGGMSTPQSNMMMRENAGLNSRMLMMMRRRGSSPDRCSVGGATVCSSNSNTNIIQNMSHHNTTMKVGSGAGGAGSPPRRLTNSPVLRSKVLANRDKESLMDEILELKKTVVDQVAQLQRQKVVAANLEADNRRLERELEEVELQGYSKSSSSRLRSKVQGLKSRVSQLEATCEAQQGELNALRRDIRVTHTRELEVERDVCLEEVERLQNFVRRLKAIQNRLYSENKQLWRYKDRNSLLEATAQRLEISSTDLQNSLEKANKEIQEMAKKGNDNFIRAKKAEHQYQDLQEKSNMLKKMVEKERSQNLKLQQMIHVLQDEVQALGSTVDCKIVANTSSIQDHNAGGYHSSNSTKSRGFLQNMNFLDQGVRHQFGEVFDDPSNIDQLKVQDAFTPSQAGNILEETHTGTRQALMMVARKSIDVQKCSTVERELSNIVNVVRCSTSDAATTEHENISIESSSKVEYTDDFYENANLMKEEERKSLIETHSRNDLLLHEGAQMKKDEGAFHEEHRRNITFANVFVPRLNLERIGGKDHARTEMSSHEATTSTSNSSGSVSNENERLSDRNGGSIEIHVNDQIRNIKEVFL